MKKILLISDTHGYLGDDIQKYAKEVDEVWHAGDWGGPQVSDQLSAINPHIRGVYGNIDGQLIRKMYPKNQFFEIEEVKIWMTHIGGYPGRYSKGIKESLQSLKPDLFICGHSHICKIVRDKILKLIHINPGAIGNKGFHQKRTMVLLSIHQNKISDVKVLEYDKNFDI